MYDIVIAAAIVVVGGAVVIGGLAFLFRGAGRKEQEQIVSLAARLKCPKCGTSPLVWTGSYWSVDIQYDYDDLANEEATDETPVGGYEIRCEACGDSWKFSDEGVRYSEEGEAP